jgi:3-hydroxyisobutyrate dehydrogenase-like beta-hydroxyacid dehydrogenase
MATVKVGFIGAGRMGTPMVGRLVAAGHDVAALSRSETKASTIHELGARAVSDPAAAVDGADVVLVCVFTDQQVREVLVDDGAAAAMAPGATLVIHTTGSPRTAQDIAAASRTLAVVDAPVSGGPHDIAAGNVTLFVGGADDAVARVHPVLASYGDPILHVGVLGAGQAVKLTNNALFAAQIGLLRNAVAFGQRLGVDEARLLDAISHGSGASRVGSYMAMRGSVMSFIGDTAEFIAKDVDVVREIAAELGGELGVLDDVIAAGIQP